MGTSADPHDTVATSGDELALRLCELVGIDPGETTSIRLEGDPAGAVVTWHGIRRVRLDHLSVALGPWGNRGGEDTDPFAERAATG